MKPLSALCLAITAACLASLSSVARAEIAPGVYLGMQAKAPEVITIEVKKSSATRLGSLDFSGDRNVSLEAEVVSVTRTAAGLKKGDKIVIHYVYRKPGLAAAPSPIPILKDGKTYPAWLSKSADGHYEPAARGFSFEVVK